MRKETQKIIGHNLRLLRTTHGLDQGDMAAIIGNSRPLYTHYELGSRSQDAESLLNIATYFGIDMASLFVPNQRDFLNIIANAINTSEQFREITTTYHKLSPYGKGRLAERALTLLDEEVNNKEKHHSILKAPFIK